MKSAVNMVKEVHLFHAKFRDHRTLERLKYHVNVSDIWATEMFSSLCSRDSKFSQFFFLNLLSKQPVSGDS